jgi:hypothetical protein
MCWLDAYRRGSPMLNAAQATSAIGASAVAPRESVLRRDADPREQSQSAMTNGHVFWPNSGWYRNWRLSIQSAERP